MFIEKARVNTSWLQLFSCKERLYERAMTTSLHDKHKPWHSSRREQEIIGKSESSMAHEAWITTVN